MIRGFLVATSLLATPAFAEPACPAIPSRSPAPVEATATPMPITGWPEAVAQLDARLAQTDPSHLRLVFIGDSITSSWDEPILRKFFGQFAPTKLGISGEATQGTLWRLQESELATLRPTLAVLLIGTNNTANGSAPEDTALGVAEIVRLIRDRSPATKVLILGLLPRGVGPSDPLRLINAKVSRLIAGCADNKSVFYQDRGAQLLDSAGRLTAAMSFDALHLTPNGYYTLSQALAPEVVRLMRP